MIDLKEIKTKIFKKENFYFLMVVFIIFFFDRYSKTQIINNLSDNAFYINDILNFNLVWNTGIGFGIFSSSSNLIYNLISALIFIVILFLIFIFLKSNKLDKTFFSLIIAGALGNFYDRMTFKAVPDFIDFHYGNFHWFTFNIADIFVSIGVICFLVKSLFTKEQ